MRFFLLLLFVFIPALCQADEKIDLRGMQLKTLIVTIQGQEIRGAQKGKRGEKNYFQPQKMIHVKSDIQETIKVELEDISGVRIDVTNDPKTSYQTMGARLETGAGWVRPLREPMPGRGTFGMDDEAALIIQYEDLENDNPYSPKGVAGSVYLYFKIAD